MKVLLVNKYYYLKSGTERYLLSLKRLLETKGHQVEVFSMQHPLNLPAAYSSSFVPHMDFHELTSLGSAKAALRVLWYPAAASRIAKVLDEFRPDVVHLFNIYHHLSPSILLPMSLRGIPIVQTLNDYKLLCPNYLLYTDGAPCVRCRGGRYFQAMLHRCLHGSLSWSFLAALEVSLHKAFRIYERHVDAFIAPSAFAKTIAEQFRLRARRLVRIPHFLFPEDVSVSSSEGGYVVYAGRLSREKGLPTLVGAMGRVPEIPLLIVGEGPIRPALERMVEERGLSNVRFAGYLVERSLARIVTGARFTVVPSECFEVFGLSILESFAAGKPVVAARIGGLPELIENGSDGLLFAPKDRDGLAECLSRLWNNPKQTCEMGLRGRLKVENQYSGETHYGSLFPVYQRSMNL